MNDFRYALRMLLKSPGFSFIAIATLALGIGANTAIFSVVEGTLLRPLPFPHAERLVRIYEAQEESGARGASVNLSDQTVARWREFGGDIFEGIGVATGVDMTVGLPDGAPTQTVSAARISANFFWVLGLPPALGRTFTQDEDRPGGPAVAIISDDFWREVLNSRPDVLGASITLDGRPHTIVGVMPKSFRHPYRSNVWVGALVTWSCFRLIQHQWAELPAPNVFGWIGGGAVLSAAVALACWLPARRAARVDPVVALRAE